MKLIFSFLAILSFSLFGCSGHRGPQGIQGPAGLQGPQGLPGRDSVIEIIDPCGPQGEFDEILLRLSNGHLVAFFRDGRDEFLIDLPPGEYRTTDDTNCFFIINEDLLVIDRF